MITQQVFDSIKEDEVFATGYSIDSPEGANMSNSGKVLKWLAAKGFGGDFAVYVAFANESWDYVESNGDKVCNIQNLKKLLSCSDEVWKKYRY